MQHGSKLSRTLSRALSKTLLGIHKRINKLHPFPKLRLNPSGADTRFAISCTSELLRGLGDMAESDDTLAIQTHKAENKGEIVFTKELFKGCKSYADVYDQHGLLCERTILAHAVHLDDHEFKLMKKAGAGISRCPTSNFNLRSGMANVGEMFDRGIKVAHCSLHIANTVI